MTVHRVKTCSCGHPIDWHEKEGRGRCTYGRGHVMGGCPCDGFSKRRRAELDGPPSPSPSPSLVRAIDDTIRALSALRKALEPPTRSVSVRVAPPPARSTAPVRATTPTLSTGKLAGAERKVLTVLAQHPDGLSKVQVAILSGYSHTSGGFRNTLSALRTAGRLDGSGERMRITDVGQKALGPFEPLPTGRALLAYWEQNAGGRCERMILGELAAVHPCQLTKEEVASRTGYAASSGGFRNALSRLRTLQLIAGRGELALSSALAGALGHG